MSRKPYGYWNIRENVDAVARECHSRSEMKAKNQYAYYAALKKGYMQDYTWFERDLDPYVGRMHIVYAYFFTDRHSFYIGRTCNQNQRDWSHRNCESSVGEYVCKTGAEFPEMTILEDNLTLDESLIYEDMYIEQYLSEGWNKINKARTGLHSGSIGSLRDHKWTRENCYKAALECKTNTEFQTKYPSAYHKSIKNGWKKDYTWFKQRAEVFSKSNSREVIQYSTEGELLKVWPSGVVIEKETGYSRSCISRCCNGRINTAYGYVWKYAKPKKAAC